MTRAYARVDLGAVRHNVRRVRASLEPGVQLCAVVKADAYGCGAAPVARAALEAGATWLAVATAAEAAELRRSGMDRVRILVLGALDDEDLETAIGARADLAAWCPEFVARVAGRAPLHVKLDTGLGRLGTRDPELADATVRAAGDRLAGLWTHLATADDSSDGFVDAQLERFLAWARPHRQRRPELLLHVANSAATLSDARTHLDLVRCGVALYGLDPFGRDPAAHGLVPALELHTHVAAVKPCAAGMSVGYGRRFLARRPTTIATVPIGYGDGWRRALGGNSDVIIRGRRHHTVGVMSMDNLTVDVGADPGVRPGDDVVLLGGGITAEEVARRLDTINYEVIASLTARVPRVHHDDRASTAPAEDR